MCCYHSFKKAVYCKNIVVKNDLVLECSCKGASSLTSCPLLINKPLPPCVLCPSHYVYELKISWGTLYVIENLTYSACFAQMEVLKITDEGNNFIYTPFQNTFIRKTPRFYFDIVVI